MRAIPGRNDDRNAQEAREDESRTCGDAGPDGRLDDFFAKSLHIQGNERPIVGQMLANEVHERMGLADLFEHQTRYSH
jgi:hypothetical protein